MKIIENALDLDFCNEVGDYVFQVLVGKDLTEEMRTIETWTNYTWDRNLRQESSLVVCYKLPNRFKERITPRFKELGLFPKETLESLNQNLRLSAYVWSKGAWINWHDDGLSKAAITVYLNQNWDPNDGGFFMYIDEKTKERKVIDPTYNTLVYGDSHELHGTTPVTSSSEVRITLQGFVV
jgi:Rps23 Pro-64 3,4-dihydroxylase Tpa1-like proline 4-hydroxylase